jgi:ketosteroid isomerase-like protein
MMPEAVVRDFWRRMASNDFDSVAAVMAADVVIEWPQSRERIRGAANFARINAEYPSAGPWRFTLERLVADGAEVVTKVRVTDGTLVAEPISFFTVEQGRISRLVEYWPEPFAPGSDRAHLTEAMD